MTKSSILAAVLAVSTILGVLVVMLPSTAVGDEFSHSSTLSSGSPFPFDSLYGYDSATSTMTDHNGFEYSYQADGIIKLVLPWGYTTHFSYGFQASYNGETIQRTALDYSWSWDATVIRTYNLTTGQYLGNDYRFVATNDDGAIDWRISFEFFANWSRMKVTHDLTNPYGVEFTDAKFWYLFDLSGTANPYVVQTALGTVEGPIYQDIPDNVTWVFLANQFKFSWQDAIEAGFSSDKAYIGDGSVVGLDGLPILGISIDLGTVPAYGTVTIDPYFSGVEKTWNPPAATGGHASLGTNWLPVGVPTTGDNVTFDVAKDCIWDINPSLGVISFIGDIGGAIWWVEDDFTCVDWNHIVPAFVLIQDTTSWVHVERNMTMNQLWITDPINRWNVEFTGGDCHLMTIDDDWVVNICNITVNGNLTVEPQAYNSFNVKSLFIKPGATLSLEHDLNFTGPGAGFSNYGQINGPNSINITRSSSTTLGHTGTLNTTIGLCAKTDTTSDINISLSQDWTGKSLSVFSDHASYTMSLLANGHDIELSDNLSIGIRGVFESGQSLISAANITTDDGVFSNDNLVTMTDDGTISMGSGNNFYNLTIESGVTTTLDTDIIVNCRARTDGDLAGSGELIQTAPTFTSTPEDELVPLELYLYEVEYLFWDNLSLDESPEWLQLLDGVLVGVPSVEDVGVYQVSLNLTWYDMATYQNFTIYVAYPASSSGLQSTELIILGIGVHLSMAIALLIVGEIRQNRIFHLFAGVVSVFAAVIIYNEIQQGWTVIIGMLGFFLMLYGGMDYIDTED